MNDYYKHEEKICPRCSKSFECKVGDIINCQCHGISFTNETMALVSKIYDDCLCRACLMSLNEVNSEF